MVKRCLQCLCGLHRAGFREKHTDMLMERSEIPAMRDNAGIRSVKPLMSLLASSVKFTEDSDMLRLWSFKRNQTEQLNQMSTAASCWLS